MQQGWNHRRFQRFDQYRASTTVLIWAGTDRCLSLPSLASPDAGTQPTELKTIASFCLGQTRKATSSSIPLCRSGEGG